MFLDFVLFDRELVCCSLNKQRTLALRSSSFFFALFFQEVLNAFGCFSRLVMINFIARVYKAAEDFKISRLFCVFTVSTLISLTLSIGAYSFVFGAPFAVGLVGQLLAHEGGHALMMRRLNIAFGPMLFVPFLGAMVANLSEVKSAYDESKIALAGPAAGTAIALALSAIGIASESQLLLSLASAGYLLNMFNLLPIGSLDGGRVASALSKVKVFVCCFVLKFCPKKNRMFSPLSPPSISCWLVLLEVHFLRTLARFRVLFSI